MYLGAFSDPEICDNGVSLIITRGHWDRGMDKKFQKKNQQNLFSIQSAIIHVFIVQSILKRNDHNQNLCRLIWKKHGIELKIQKGVKKEKTDLIINFK